MLARNKESHFVKALLLFWPMISCQYKDLSRDELEDWERDAYMKEFMTAMVKCSATDWDK
jgi:hypothetical protein